MKGNGVCCDYSFLSTDDHHCGFCNLCTVESAGMTEKQRVLEEMRRIDEEKKRLLAKAKAKVLEDAEKQQRQSDEVAHAHEVEKQRVCYYLLNCESETWLWG